MNKCAACEDKFEWDDELVVVNDDFYHKNCLSLYPTGYIAFLDGEPLGETENEDGQQAWEILDGLLDDEEDESEDK